jgi:hypothetical protein
VRRAIEKVKYSVVVQENGNAQIYWYLMHIHMMCFAINCKSRIWQDPPLRWLLVARKDLALRAKSVHLYSSDSGHLNLIFYAGGT